MNVLTETLSPRHEHHWPLSLRNELTPFPGRAQMTVRLVACVVLITVISMTLRVPQLAFQVFFIYFVTKEHLSLTTRVGAIMIMGSTISTVITVFLYKFTFDYPELRIPMMASVIFIGMFLSRALVIGPLGFMVGFSIALYHTIGEAALNTDTLVRNLLWLWTALTYATVLAILVNQVLLPVDPWAALVQALTLRLEAVRSVVLTTLKNGSAGGQINSALIEMGTRGSSPLRALLNFAESKDVRLKRRHSSLVATIAASEHLLNASGALAFRQPQTLSADDRRCAEALLVEIAHLKAVLPEHDPVLPLGKSDVAQATLPQLRELQFASETFRDGLIRYVADAAPATTSKWKNRVFVADAFTNTSYVRFALKVTVSAMICYIIYNAVDWHGISTAFVTCCFIGLENTGATIRKAWLRLLGCASGGLFGYLAILFLIPHMESIASLVLLAAMGAAMAGWISAGGERISYAGVQFAFAFFVCVFQGYAPDTNLALARDRLVGIALGITVTSIVYRQIWPEHAIDALRAALARVLRNFANLILIPQSSEGIEDEYKAADALQSANKSDLDLLSRLSELAIIEKAIIDRRKGVSPEVLERITGQTQALSLLMTALSRKTKLEEWRRLDQSVQQIEIVLRASASEQLQQISALLEGGPAITLSSPDAAFATWNRAVSQVTDNDRPRLVRRVTEQIHQLAQVGVGIINSYS
jgi:multidrug resistance protein MdtO